MTLADFAGSGSDSIWPKATGTICHETPNLSRSQPHRLGSPPSDSFSHKWSTSSCVSQFTKNEMAGVKLNWGPPFSAVNVSPSSLKRGGHYTALRTRPRFSESANTLNFGIFENGSVKLHRFFGLAVEPQEWADLLHIVLPLPARVLSSLGEALEPLAQHRSDFFGLLHGRHVRAVLDYHQLTLRHQCGHLAVAGYGTPQIFAPAHNHCGTAKACKHGCSVRPFEQGLDLCGENIGSLAVDHLDD
jgi:hypothetical protein